MNLLRWHCPFLSGLDLHVKSVLLSSPGNLVHLYTATAHALMGEKKENGKEIKLD